MAGPGEREHFARIAQASSEEERERAVEALGRSQVERILEGLALGAAAPTDAAIEAMLDRRAEGQAELAARARRLGLYRSVR